MDKELKAKWLEALRSGQYRQYSGGLYEDQKGGHCCLHVLALVAKLPVVDAEQAIGGYKVTSPLIDMNDGRCGQKQHSFAEIADYIEANL